MKWIPQFKEMLDLFAARGIFTSDLEAKVFGGATILNFGHESRYGVGKRNIECAIETLIRSGFDVKNSHVGGEQAMCLYFLSDVGDVFLRTIEQQSFIPL